MSVLPAIRRFSLAGYDLWAGWAFSENGLVAMEYGEGEPVISQVENLREAGGHSPSFKAWDRAMTKWLSNYAAKRFTPLGVPLDTTGMGPFQARVLRTLAEKVPVGKTVSYGELATLSGAPRAARAVGTTMATHDFAFAVPCHRVLHGSGSLTRYGSKGAFFKLLLLAHEDTDPVLVKRLAEGNGVRWSDITG